MKIERIEVDRFDIQPPKSLAISFCTLNTYENFILRLYFEHGVVGWGEGAPLQPITGDSREQALSEAGSIQLSDLPLCDTPAEFYDRFLTGLSCSSLKAALDAAFHDAYARQQRLPVYRLYRSEARRVPNSITVFLQDDLSDTSDEVRRILRQYPDLEILKVKLDGKNDIERCQAIRVVCSAGMKFVLDANQAFQDETQAVQVINELTAILGGIVVVEEPCPKGDLERLHYVRCNANGTPIFADESCTGEKDLDLIAACQAADGINIKLQKVGGIVAARRLAEKARSLGIQIMVGQMFESPLSTAAGIAFSCTTDDVVLTDLDMDLDFPVFCTGKAPLIGGARLPLDNSGFGFELMQSQIDESEGSIACERLLVID